jgi:flavin-binding protein dodecin
VKPVFVPLLQKIHANLKGSRLCRGWQRGPTVYRLLALIASGLSKEVPMSVARVVEISSTSKKSFEDAMVQGIARASKTLREIRSAWVKEQEVQVDGGKIAAYKVNLMVTFVLEDTMGE